MMIIPRRVIILFQTTPTTSFVHVDSTSQNYSSSDAQYNCNASTKHVLTQNPPQTFMNISSSLNILPPHMDTFNFSPEIIIREIPGYDVIYIPKSYSFVNSNV